MIYLAPLIIFKTSGRRTLSEITTFDFVLLLVIGEATRRALLGDDFSVTNAIVVIVSLVAMDIILSLIKRRSPRVAKVMDGNPIIIVQDGEVLKRRDEKARLDESDILEAARNSHGLTSLDQISLQLSRKADEYRLFPQGKADLF